MPNRPPVIPWPTDVVLDGRAQRLDDPVTVEEPLEIVVGVGDEAGKPLSITMRTPGHDRELAVGFLFAEGIIDGADDLVAVVETADDAKPLDNRIEVRLRTSGGLERAATARHFFTSSACGVCGKAAVDSVFTTPVGSLDPGPIVPGELIGRLPVAMQPAQVLFARTGSIHAAALFSAAGELRFVREDIGRHNAVDKIVGACLLAGEVPLADSVLVVSGRVGFEIAQKALRAGVPILAAVGAPSDLALRVASRGGMTTVGFVRDGRYNVYTGHDRIVV